MNKWVIVIGILILVGLGLLFISNMTGNAITGAATAQVVEEEYYKMTDAGKEIVNDSIEVARDFVDDFDK